MRALWPCFLVVLFACGKPAEKNDGGPGGGTGGGSATGGGAASGGGTGGGGDDGGSTGGGGGGTGGGGGGDAGQPDCTATQMLTLSIPMRDGKSLGGFARVPTNAACQLPTVLIQTPYGAQGAVDMWLNATTPQPLFNSPDYAFVMVDWRGFFSSMAAKVTGQQPYGDDGYDTVEWIATQPWSNGKVATWGVSALCVQQYKTAAKQPPHLAAAVPIFCEMNNTYLGYYPGGVLREEYLQFVGGYFGAAAITTVPYRTGVWSAAEGAISGSDIQVPMMEVAGWYDLFPAGSFNTWNELTGSGTSVAGQHRLVIGPWIHFAVGGESHGGRMLTAQELEYVDSAHVVQTDSLAFFDLHLRGITSSPAAAWQAVQYERDVEHVWEQSPTWPPAGQTPLTYYLAPNGALATAAPGSSSGSYPYDPADPSPTIGGSTLMPTLLHGPEDQAPVLARGDNLAFQSDVLTQPLRIRGPLATHLEVATTGADTDFEARLTDVSADGGQLLIAEGVRRLKLRDGYNAPSPVDAGTRYGVDLFYTAHAGYTFEAGHRVGLIISSSNWPRFERNANTGADHFDGGAPVPVTNTIYFDSSTLTLPAD